MNFPYGFLSPDSDFDLRGVHILPLSNVLSLNPCDETITESFIKDSVELDLVTHDVKKFFGLLLNRNGYVLEQLYSPLIIKTSDEHIELKDIARGCITRHHVHHYLGFAINQWKLLHKTVPYRVKPLLYVFRVLLTGIHLMKTGALEANILLLNQHFGLTYIDELVRHKVESREKQSVPEGDFEFYVSEFNRLLDELESAGAASKLPERSSARDALNDLLIRVRLGFQPGCQT